MGSRRSRQRPDKREIAAELQRTDEPPLSMSMFATREDYERAEALLEAKLNAKRLADEAAQEIEARDE